MRKKFHTKLRQRHSGAPYFLDYQDEKGRRRRVSTGETDLHRAEIKKGEILRSVELAKLGATESSEGDCDLADLAVEFCKHLDALGRSELHRLDVARTLGSLIDFSGATKLRDFDTTAIDLALAKYQEGRSSRTRNKARGFVLHFFRWLVRADRWNKNPVRAVKRVREDDKQEFRALTVEELDQLLSSVPEYRRDVYLFAAHTGLRRKELGLLEWGDLDLERRIVSVRRRNAKNKEPDVVAFTETALELLKEIKTRRSSIPGERVFSVVPRNYTFYNDLERVGIPIETANGKMTFHGLRRTFGTQMAEANVPLAHAQRQMRHSTPVLTSNIYTKVRIEAKRQAADMLEKRLSKKTGEDAA